MKRLFVILVAVLAAAPVLGAERSVGLSASYGPDSYLVDYPSGKQQTVSISASYTEVYKKEFFRFGWSANLGYKHLWGDNVETKTDIDEAVERNNAQDTFSQMVAPLSEYGITEPSEMISSYQWIYSDFHGFKTSGLALAGVEYGVIGADILSGLGVDYAFMKTELGDLEFTRKLYATAGYIRLKTGQDITQQLNVDSIKDSLGGTCHMMQFSVPLEIRPFVKVTKSIKIVGAAKTDIYSLNLLFGDQTYTKNLWFRNWEFGLGAEFVF